MISKGDRVEMFDGSMKGTIIEVKNEYFIVVKWDDGEIGNVHPLDVKHLKQVEDRMPRVNPKASAITRDRQLRKQQEWLKQHHFKSPAQAKAAGY